MLGHPGLSLDHIGAILEPSWVVLGPYWGHVWGHLGNAMAPGRLRNAKWTNKHYKMLPHIYNLGSKKLIEICLNIAAPKCMLSMSDPNPKID